MSVDVLLFVPKWPAPAASVFEVGAAVINAQLVQTNQKLSERVEYCVPMPISNLEALLYQLMQRKTCGCQLILSRKHGQLSMT